MLPVLSALADATPPPTVRSAPSSAIVAATAPNRLRADVLDEGLKTVMNQPDFERKATDNTDDWANEGCQGLILPSKPRGLQSATATLR